ncbi:hypothetical protein [Aeromonas allosaccharophila]|uniref:hypothetical protein n=1 Tax=Aeromonas allosaccharophila TaxID=656 RepID=UPI002ADF9D4F|nr:hypothetical protein [Aeromonas allosaccharophila]
MRELTSEELSVVAGGWQTRGATTGDMGSPHEGRGNNRGGGNGNPNNTWNTNDSLSATVIRNAGFGAIGGALAGPGFAAGGAVLGAMVGFSEYNNHGSNRGGRGRPDGGNGRGGSSSKN